MSDLKELIDHEMESFIEWDGDDKSIVTTTSAKLFAEHVAGLWADHVAGAGKMVTAVQGEPVAFCEDAALSIAERTFSTDVDEQLASDIIQYAQRLHSLYAAPQPAEQQREPCHECGGNGAGGEHEEDCSQQPAPDVDSQILKLIEDECRYWYGRDEARRGGYASLYAKAKEMISKQQPSPDATQLAEALEGIMRVEARDRVMPVGAEWDAARAALAPYRKGGDI